MKTIMTLSIVLLSVFSFGQGIEFFEGSWQEALDAAKKENKIIFVDAYAEWCGPCKRMAATVFTTKEAGDFYNNNFINYKMDMEKGEGPSFGRKYPVRAFPTLMFIDFDGKKVHQKVGAQNTPSFIELGKAALKMVDRSGQYAALYEKGDRSPELIYNYIAALNQAGKPSNKIANTYLRNQKDLSSEINQKIIFEATTQVDSRAYTLFSKNLAGIKSIYNAEQIDLKITKAGKKTLQTAIEFSDTDLYNEAKEKVAAVATAQAADEFQLEADLIFGFTNKDFKLYSKALKNYAKAFPQLDNLSQAKKYVSQGLNLIRADKKVANGVVDLAEAMTKSEQATYQEHILLANVYSKLGNQKQAVNALNQAEKMATKQKKVQQQIQRLREKMLQEGAKS